jgi:putative protein kinase ArgK-like GTPase of G3E family
LILIIIGALAKYMYRMKIEACKLAQIVRYKEIDNQTMRSAAEALKIKLQETQWKLDETAESLQTFKLESQHLRGMTDALQNTLQETQEATHQAQRRQSCFRRRSSP